MRFPALHRGFSLIELLVTVAISMVLLGGALAGFISFADRQAVTTSVEDLKTLFARAQSKAISGDLGGCDVLSGYRIQSFVTDGVTQVSLRAVCSTGTADPSQIQSLPEGITLSPTLDLTFQVLNAGVSGVSASGLDIMVSNSDNDYLFTLYREGRTSQGDWQ